MIGKRAFGYVAALALGGCAGVSGYQDETVRHNEGICYYPPRPFLLTTRTDGCNHPMAVSVVYIPDLRCGKAQYVSQTGGIGSGGLTLECENGIAKSLTQKPTDAKVAEMIDALGKAGITFIAGREVVRELK